MEDELLEGYLTAENIIGVNPYMTIEQASKSTIKSKRRRPSLATVKDIEKMFL